MARALNEPLPNLDGANIGAPMDRFTPVPRAGDPGEMEKELTPRETEAVNTRQDELMASESADGRPPSHRQRMTGWRWIAIVLPVALISAAGGALLLGVNLGAVIGFGIASALLLLLGSWPIWSAGLLRVGEETSARKEAIAELRPAAPGRR